MQRLKRRQSGQLTFDDLIAKAPTMQQVIRLGRRAAQSNIPILIEGGSGVGKELIARAIQGASDRGGKPFVAVNCGALPENLVESILFGHEKGSFTGASDKHMGKFQEASGGTLFLDEIGELRLDIQVKLLRALQEGEVDPVGASKPVKVDIRLISATNRDLLEDGAGRRVPRRPLLPPQCVPDLCAAAARSAGKTSPISLTISSSVLLPKRARKSPASSPRASNVLVDYTWPGNVRQLENAVFRAVVLAEDEWLSLHDFPQIAGFMQVTLPERAHCCRGGGRRDGGRNDIRHQPPASAQAANASPIYAPIYTTPPTTGATRRRASRSPIPSGHVRPLDEIEGQMIKLAIEKYDGHMSEVARRLGIGRSTLYRKVRDLGLDHGAKNNRVRGAALSVSLNGRSEQAIPRRRHCIASASR